MALLSVSADAKTVKGEPLGFLTWIQYLAPADTAGVNVCPWATAGCKESCLFTAGRGKFNSVREARIRRTREFLAGPAAYRARLVEEIEAALLKSKRLDLVPLFRLNGTSDLDWRAVIALFPMVQFYDYTKSV